MYLLLIDFGMVILIWLVQLIIYPGLLHYRKEELSIWHDKYTTLITYIVLPLMLSQLLLHAYEVYDDFNWLRLFSFVAVLFTWAITFFYAIPLHGNVSANKYVSASLIQLIKINWIRTILWSQIFIIDLLVFHGIFVSL